MLFESDKFIFFVVFFVLFRLLLYYCYSFFPRILMRAHLGNGIMNIHKLITLFFHFRFGFPLRKVLNLFSIDTTLLYSFNSFTKRWKCSRVGAGVCACVIVLFYYIVCL